MQKNGDENTQRELTSVVMSIAELFTYFIEKVKICVRHYGDIHWLKLHSEIQLNQLRPGELFILTDFAATMNLGANEKLNCATDCHTVAVNFVCLHNCRTVQVRNSDTNAMEEIDFFTVDVHHGMAETFSKSKKCDHVMHLSTLRALIEHYTHLFLNQDPTNLLRCIFLGTDNAPGQYRCVQAFIATAMSNVEIRHCLAVPANFKGVHDAVGKDVEQHVKNLENRGIRSATAFNAFKNCIRYGLEKNDGNTEWKKCELEGDK